MKKYLNKKIIPLIISILIIILGIILLCLNGFEKAIEYKAGTRIEVLIPNGYKENEIVEIAKECFDTDEILFSEIEKLNQVAGIKVVKYSEEQLENYINKVSEKYELDKEDIEYHEVLIPETSISTIITPYILPVFFTTTIVLMYIVIKNYKSNDGVKIPLKVLKMLVITLGLYFSFIVLFRLQFNIYTMPIALALYIVILLITVNKKCE